MSVSTFSALSLQLGIGPLYIEYSLKNNDSGSAVPPAQNWSVFDRISTESIGSDSSVPLAQNCSILHRPTVSIAFSLQLGTGPF